MSSLFSCLFLPLLDCLTKLPLGSYPECPHSCRLSTDLFREAASCHVGDWGIIFHFYFYFFLFFAQQNRLKGPAVQFCLCGVGSHAPHLRAFPGATPQPSWPHLSGKDQPERERACPWGRGKEEKPRWGSKAFDLGALEKAH